MAGTDPAGTVRPLSAHDLPGALALSAAAHWNQVEADWRWMLGAGQGWGLHVADDRGASVLAASALILPYGEDFAWTSMVLVAPAFRRRGFATRLLQIALEAIAADGRIAMLDATPAGRPVYLPLGFQDCWGFTRHRRTAAVHASPSGRSRPLAERDWPAIAALDRSAFGADRLPLLRHLAIRQPAAARVVESAGRLRGAVFARDGRTANQIGPLLADEPSTALALLDDALAAMPGAVCVDLLDRRRDALAPWLAERAFVAERPFMRMARGRAAAPGSAERTWLVAGPELG